MAGLGPSGGTAAKRCGANLRSEPRRSSRTRIKRVDCLRNDSAIRRLLRTHLLLHSVDGLGLALTHAVLLHEGAVEAGLQLQLDLGFVQIGQPANDGLQEEDEQQDERVLWGIREKKGKV